MEWSWQPDLLYTDKVEARWRHANGGNIPVQLIRARTVCLKKREPVYQWTKSKGMRHRRERNHWSQAQTWMMNFQAMYKSSMGHLQYQRAKLRHPENHKHPIWNSEVRWAWSFGILHCTFYFILYHLEQAYFWNSSTMRRGGKKGLQTLMLCLTTEKYDN